MAEVNLLARLPATKRNIQKRAEAQTAENIAVAREYGEIYFDGPRELGYGGYRYDGRWIPIAEDIVRHFGLEPGDRVLDVGCAKGFLVRDLMTVCPGLEAFGLDISHYALTHAEPAATGRFVEGSAEHLPFASESFDAVLSINTIHNLPREEARQAIAEIERLAPGKGYIQVDSYRSDEQREIFLSWVLTAKFHDFPEGWIQLFREAGYTGDWNWTIVE
jgi:cyclopropane fatty-acyl-phospholipid synthase-like methyltransferase